MKAARKPTNRFFSVSRPLGQIGLAETKDGVEAVRLPHVNSNTNRAGGLSRFRRFIMRVLAWLIWRSGSRPKFPADARPGGCYAVRTPFDAMTQRRWLRIIPVALVMYTISYVDRTNISLALDPTISSMLRDLLMDDRMKGEAAGIFFFGYVLLQIPGGYWATAWSARKVISLFLIAWGVCAVGCGLARTFRQFEVMRFLLGVAESGVFPATLVLLATWFPRSERARANAYWMLCQPLAVAATAPFTGWLLGAYGWQQMLILEGLLPFLWLPVWWFCIRDHPREARWISAEERSFLETTLQREAAELEPPQAVSLWARLGERPVSCSSPCISCRMARLTAA